MDLDHEIPLLDAPQMRDLAEIQCRDLMNQDPPTHWVLFLYCDVFVEYILIKIVYIYLKYYGIFLYGKST